MADLDRVRLRLDRVRRAVEEIDPIFVETALPPCAALGEALGCSVMRNVETLNSVRCFKGRRTETITAVASRRARPSRDDSDLATCERAATIGLELVRDDRSVALGGGCWPAMSTTSCMRLQTMLR